MAAERGVRIWEQLQDHYAGVAVDGFRLVMVITDGNLMPNEVFLYEPLPPGYICDQQPPVVIGAQGPQADGRCAVLVSVCSPVDLVEYPALAPTPGSNPPYFRLNYADLLFRSRKEAADIAKEIKDDVGRLVRSMNANDSLGPPARFWVGEVAPAGAQDTLIVPQG
jgi:hypothetical protein